MLLKGYTKSCGNKKLAGVKKIGLIPIANLTGVSYDTPDTESIKSVTMAASSAFKKYEFEQDECEFQENYKVENGTQMVEQKITFKLATMSKDSRAAVEEIAKESDCGLVAAVSMPGGRTVIVGWDADLEGERPLRLQSTTGTTGKKLGDASGEEITLGRDSTIKAHYYIGEEGALYTTE